MWIQRFCAAVAVVCVLATAALANEPGCYLRSQGRIFAGAGAAAPIVVDNAFDSGFIVGSASLPVLRTVAYTSPTIAANQATTSHTGTVEFGKICLDTSVRSGGTGFGRINQAGPNAPAPSGNAIFVDQLTFNNPTLGFGAATQWEFSLQMSGSITGGIGSNYNNRAVAKVFVDDVEVQTVNLSQAGGSALLSISNRTFNNGDVVTLRVELMHDVNISTSPLTTRAFELDTCVGFGIKSLTAGGKLETCSGANYTPVPEPASMTALGLGLLAVARKRRAAKKS
jgi:hypothetical protein